ncbi:MAG: hypothetical protein HWD61_12885 [Parachlamydiaceae bacterium]|nr:MAG: hypothetical protein HWD61_12885 [Parachlamydiaceae bacterium]
MDVALTQRGFDVDYRSFSLGNSGIVVVELKSSNVHVKATSGLRFLPENQPSFK